VLRWFKDDKPVKSEEAFLGHPHQFVIYRAIKSNAGPYRCVAKNKYGSVESELIILTVAVRSCPPYPPSSASHTSYLRSWTSHTPRAGTCPTAMHPRAHAAQSTTSLAWTATPTEC
jgi:hypothetical protein